MDDLITKLKTKREVMKVYEEANRSLLTIDKNIEDLESLISNTKNNKSHPNYSQITNCVGSNLEELIQLRKIGKENIKSLLKCYEEEFGSNK